MERAHINGGVDCFSLSSQLIKRETGGGEGSEKVEGEKEERGREELGPDAPVEEAAAGSQEERRMEPAGECHSPAVSQRPHIAIAGSQ